MASFAHLLSARAFQFKTRQALLILNPQNIFLSPQAHLNVLNVAAVTENVSSLASHFRTHGEVVWVHSKYAEPRTVNDGLGDSVHLDGEANRQDGSSAATPSTSQTNAPACAEDLFLSQSSGELSNVGSEASSFEIAECMKPLFVSEKDLVVVTSSYSALNSTSLLTTLRMKLITELYICGNTTNVSVYATTMEAAQHGFSIHLIGDCLGYRDETIHKRALDRLVCYTGASLVTTAEVLERRDKEPGVPLEEPPTNGVHPDIVTLSDYLQRMSLGRRVPGYKRRSDYSDTSSANSRPPSFSPASMSRSSTDYAYRPPSDSLEGDGFGGSQATEEKPCCRS